MSEVDEDALFFGEEAEDLAGDIKSELISWPKRFPRDLASTLEQAEQRQTVCKHCVNKLRPYRQRCLGLSKN